MKWDCGVSILKWVTTAVLSGATNLSYVFSHVRRKAMISTLNGLGVKLSVVIDMCLGARTILL